MAYAQDTITSVNAANDFVAVLDGLLGDAGWETVETLTPSGNNRNRIYKSPGTDNLCGYDWYIVVSWQTVGTERYVTVIPFESYNTASKIASGVCAAPTGDISTSLSGQVTVSRAFGYTSAATLNASTNVPGLAPTTFTYNRTPSSNPNISAGFQTLLPSSAFGYWASVTLDHVALFTTVAANRINAVMSTLILDDDYEADPNYSSSPLVCWSENGFALSSHLIASSTPTNADYVALAARYTGTYGSKLPTLDDGLMAAYAWQPYVYLNYLTHGTTNPDTQIVGEVVVGRVPDFWLVWGGSIGDTVEIDSATHVLTGTIAGAAAWAPTCALLVE